MRNTLAEISCSSSKVKSILYSFPSSIEMPPHKLLSQWHPKKHMEPFVFAFPQNLIPRNFFFTLAPLAWILFHGVDFVFTNSPRAEVFINCSSPCSALKYVSTGCKTESGQSRVGGIGSCLFLFIRSEKIFFSKQRVHNDLILLQKIW